MLAQLESKITDLQTRIESTQEQITHLETFKVYYSFCRYCKYKTTYSLGAICPNCGETRTYVGNNTYLIGMEGISENPKQQELNKAQAQLATLQNELKTTQAQYEQEKEQQTKRAMILNQAFVSPPPKQNTSKPKSA